MPYKKIVITLLINVGLFFAVANAQDMTNPVPVTANSPLLPEYSCLTTPVYEVILEMTLPMQQQPVAVRATLEKTPILIKDNLVLTKYTTNISSTTELAETDIVEIKKQFNRSIYVLHEKLGAINAVYGNATTPAWEYNLIKALVLSTQWVLPASQTIPTHYQIKEQDDKGIVVADYTLQTAGVHKTRKFYEKTWAGALNLEIQNSDIKISVNADHLISSIDFQETIRVKVMENSFFSTHYRQQFTLKEVKTTPKDVADLCANTSLEEIMTREKLVKLPFSGVADEEKLKQLKKEQLKEVNVDKLLFELQKQEAKFEQLMTAFNTLTDVFTYYPEHLQKVLPALEQNLSNQMFVRYLVSAVAHAASPEAQSTLLTILKKYQDNSLILQNVIMGHHFSPSPAQENIDFLISLYKEGTKEIKDFVILALGSIAKKVDAPKPVGQAHPLTEFIVAELDKTEMRESKITLLEALGNAGDIVALPGLKKLLAHSTDTEITSRAIAAMRQMPTEKVEEELVSLLKEKLEESPQIAVLKALQGRMLRDTTIEVIIGSYAKLTVDAKLEALNLLLEAQQLKRQTVTDFIKKLRESDQLTEFEKKKLATSTDQSPN